MYTASDHTFVVCAYGESPYLHDCVETLVNQEVKTDLLIATTTPNVLISEVAEEFAVRLVVNAGEPSIAHDWNCALSHVKTSLATIAHQDDMYSEHYTEALLAYCNRAKEPLLFFTDYGEIRMSSTLNKEGIVADDTPMLRIKRLMLTPLKNKKLWGSVTCRRFLLSFGSPICCPSVTYCLPNLPKPVFHEGMRGGLDWDAWERISKIEGDFVYAPEILMRHRIHEESETSALIREDVRETEDLEIFRRFWPAPIASVVNRLYRLSQRSNSL